MGNQPKTKREKIARTRNRDALTDVLNSLRRRRDLLFTAHISEGLDTVGVVSFLHKQVTNVEGAMQQLGFFVAPDENVGVIVRTLGGALDA